MIQPKFKLIHPNMKNTGSYVDMSILPANENDSGCMMVTFVPQKTVGTTENGKRVMPTFDYEKKVVVKINILEVCQLVDVFEGCQESIDEGKGLFHRSQKGNTIINLSHKIEPTPGYWMSVKRKPTDGDEQKIGIFLTPTEGRTLSIILKQAMFFMGFGVPEKLNVAMKNQ